MTQRWRLPDGVEDLLPAVAADTETLRRALLDGFRSWGYDLVSPPMVEYLESLLLSADRELDLRTFKLIDQLSGRSLGLRADITPQVARIDAHLLGGTGINRLCYCGSVLHAIPRDVFSTREPLQIGAELYGFAGVEADFEIVSLMAEALQRAHVPEFKLDLGHAGVFRSLIASAGVDELTRRECFEAVQAKDESRLRQALDGVPDPMRSAILSLPSMCGEAGTIERMTSQIMDAGGPGVHRALADLIELSSLLADHDVSFDLADLRSYDYHTGLVFAAYSTASPAAIALGGRYDGIGASFGKHRPATGFSMDLRNLVGRLPAQSTSTAVCAPKVVDRALDEAIRAARQRGEVVIRDLSGNEIGAAGTRRFVVRDGQWVIEVNRG